MVPREIRNEDETVRSLEGGERPVADRNRRILERSVGGKPGVVRLAVVVRAFRAIHDRTALDCETALVRFNLLVARMRLTSIGNSISIVSPAFQALS